MDRDDIIRAQQIRLDEKDATIRELRAMLREVLSHEDRVVYKGSGEHWFVVGCLLPRDLLDRAETLSKEPT